MSASESGAQSRMPQSGSASSRQPLRDGNAADQSARLRRQREVGSSGHYHQDKSLLYEPSTAAIAARSTRDRGRPIYLDCHLVTSVRGRDSAFSADSIIRKRRPSGATSYSKEGFRSVGGAALKSSSGVED
jgi:hypothetical protein